MKEGWKIAGVVALLATVSADLGTRITLIVGSPDSQKRAEQWHDHSGGDQTDSYHSAPPFAESGPARASESDPRPHSDTTQNPPQDQTGASIWVVLQGLSAPFVAAFTIVLTVVAVFQVKAANKQALLTHQNYLATHRPRLHVSGMLTDGARDTYVYVRNRGPNNAKHVAFDAVFVLWQNGEKIPPGDEGIAPVRGRGIDIIECGMTATYQPTAIRTPVPINWDYIRSGHVTLDLVGRITYHDDMDVLRNTGFGWTYNHITEQFVRPGKENEHNYED